MNATTPPGRILRPRLGVIGPLLLARTVAEVVVPGGITLAPPWPARSARTSPSSSASAGHTSTANCHRSRCRPTTANEAAATGAPGDKATTKAYLDDGHVLINTAAFVLISSGMQHQPKTAKLQDNQQAPARSGAC
jgi:hypothetical protein